MNVNDSAQRLRVPPNGASGGLNPRPAQDGRNGVYPVMNIAGTTAQSRTEGSQLSRAEKFEDEKRRIVESCFGKTDLDGTSMPSHAFVKFRGQ